MLDGLPCLMLLLAGLTLGVGCRPSGEPAGAAPAWSIVASGDTAGWIAPCGCATQQSGGLARRASYVEALRAERAVVVVEVGGAPAGTSLYDELKFDAILRGELAMGLAAHNIGQAECALGAQRLRDIAAELSVPFISANLRDAAGRPLFPPLRMVEVSGRRLALVGVISPKLVGDGWQTSEPAAAVLAALAAAKGRYDTVAVLAYLPAEELESLARALPEIDVLVGGPTRQSIEPRKLGPVLLAAVTNQGKFLARLDAPTGRQRDWQGEIVAMDSTLPDGPWQIENLKSLRRELAQRDLRADQTGLVGQLVGESSDHYRVAGSDACRACHVQDFASWQSTQHATAWQTLAQREAQADSFCQQCHTTGYGLPGGFTSIALSPRRTSVGCESCHGPAQAHVADPHVKTSFAARDQCQRCHDRENSPRFEFARYWNQIRHGSADRETATSSGSESVP